MLVWLITAILVLVVGVASTMAIIGLLISLFNKNNRERKWKWVGIMFTILLSACLLWYRLSSVNLGWNH